MIVVVPMAGRGTSFASKGYDIPKPLIKVHGKPMVCRALESLIGLPISTLIFVALQEHEDAYGVQKLLKNYNEYATEFIFLDGVTEGQLCTVMAAERFFDSGEDLLIISSDTYIKSKIEEDVRMVRNSKDGIISVFDLPGNRWSFARTDVLGNVVEVAEKKRISNHASTGLYYFSNAKVFRSFARELIASGERTKNEYYIIPLYQKMIDNGLKIGVAFADEVWDMGTPEAKLKFEHYLSSQ